MAHNKNWFTEWFDSPYYHKLYFERDEQEAANFINRLVNRLQIQPAAQVLDVGCGRGQHAKLLAAKGFDVTGVDLAPAAIAYAQQFEKDNLHFFQHDIRLPFWINFFDYAFNIFNSFGYFRTEREHYNAIRTLAGAVKSQGVLVVDYLNVHYEEDQLVHKQEKIINDVTYYITKWFDETHFYKKVIIEDEALHEPLEYTEQIAKFSLGDFNDMFAFNGLQLQEVFGDYDLNAYDIKQSPRLIMLARKP